MLERWVVQRSPRTPSLHRYLACGHVSSVEKTLAAHLGVGVQRACVLCASSGAQVGAPRSASLVAVRQPRASMRPGQRAHGALCHQCCVSYGRSTCARHGSTPLRTLDSVGSQPGGLAVEGRLEHARGWWPFVLRLRRAPPGPMAKSAPQTLASRPLHDVAGRHVVASRPFPSACHGLNRLLGPRAGCGPSWRPALAFSKVRDMTQVKYSALLLRLLGWLHLSWLPKWSPSQWDEALVQYIENAFDRGLSIADMLKLPSALIWAVPALGGCERCCRSRTRPCRGGIALYPRRRGHRFPGWR